MLFQKITHLRLPRFISQTVHILAESSLLQGPGFDLGDPSVSVLPSTGCVESDERVGSGGVTLQSICHRLVLCLNLITT